MGSPVRCLATFTYDKDGKARTVRVAPDKPDDEDAELPYETIDSILEEIVPEKERGKYLMGTFLDMVCLPKNNCFGSIKDYELVNLYYNSGKVGGHYAILTWRTDEERRRAIKKYQPVDKQ